MAQMAQTDFAWVEPPHRCTLGIIQVPVDLVMDMEGPELLKRFPGVEWRFQKLTFEGDSEEIKAETF